MKKALVGSLATLLTTAGLGLTQNPAPVAPPPTILPPAGQQFGVPTDGSISLAAPIPSTGQGPMPVARMTGPANNPGGCYPVDSWFEEPLCSAEIWFSPEYLLWGIKDTSLPAVLVTQGVPPTNGILGQPGTKVLLGDSAINNDIRHGGRLTMGLWCDSKHCTAFELTGFFLVDRTVNHTLSSSGMPGSPLLAVPFFNVTTNASDSTFLSDPTRSFGGRATLSIDTELQGGEANLFFDLASTAFHRVELFTGLRYIHLRQGLDFRTASPNVAPAAPDVFETFDKFQANNNFYGWQFGGRLGCSWERWSVQSIVKLALGGTSETVDIDGGLATNDFNGFGVVQTFPGGYFAQPTNIGSYHRSRFTLVPEFTFNVGYQLNRWSRFFLGYTWLYMTDVALPNSFLNPYINPTQSPAINGAGASIATFTGPPQPSPAWHSNDFWAQGLNIGLEFKF